MLSDIFLPITSLLLALPCEHSTRGGWSSGPIQHECAWRRNSHPVGRHMENSDASLSHFNLFLGHSLAWNSSTPVVYTRETEVPPVTSASWFSESQVESCLTSWLKRNLWLKRKQPSFSNRFLTVFTTYTPYRLPILILRYVLLSVGRREGYANHSIGCLFVKKNWDIWKTYIYF